MARKIGLGGRPDPRDPSWFGRAKRSVSAWRWVFAAGIVASLVPAGVPVVAAAVHVHGFGIDASGWAWGMVLGALGWVYAGLLMLHFVVPLGVKPWRFGSFDDDGRLVMPTFRGTRVVDLAALRRVQAWRLRDFRYGDRIIWRLTDQHGARVTFVLPDKNLRLVEQIATAAAQQPELPLAQWTLRELQVSQDGSRSPGRRDWNQSGAFALFSGTLVVWFGVYYAIVAGISAS